MLHLKPNSLLQGGKYKIIRFLSSGGFGCTYEGEHVMLHKRIAIKEFFVKDFCNRDENTSHVTVGTQSKVALVEKLRNKFIDEAVALSQLSHPNIVGVSDVFMENGTAYYVMDYIDGKSLHQIVNERGALPEKEAISYITDVAEALKYVHSLNRLHLDIKPGNIMVTNDGHAKLIDFGASKQYDEVDGENTSTLLGKTPGYAPIEQMGNTIRTFTPATDIYALGATLYKMITGETPADATLMASGEELKPLPTSITEKCRNAVYKAIQTNRMKRPQCIEEFMTLLNSTEDGINNDVADGIEEITLIDVNSDVQAKKDGELVKPNVISFDIKGVPLNMIKVEGGTFEMKEYGFFKDIKQTTTLSDYYIGKTQVTQVLWKAVMGTNPSYFKGDNLPVECVSWNDCQKFISRLNSMTGQYFRLPTEAEWEFAARGGNRTNHCQYSGSDRIKDVAWYGRNSGGNTQPVAKMQPNELGIYDMTGNVWEWCSDWYGPYKNGIQTNPTGLDYGFARVGRGGSWYDSAKLCYSCYRSYSNPDFRDNSVGFRLALVP